MTTDMKKVNEIARCLLYLEPEFNKDYMLVRHPFFNSYIFPKRNINDGFYELSKPRELDEARKIVEKDIAEVKNYGKYLTMIQKPYLPAFFKYTKDFVSDEDYNKFLAYMWILVEFSNSDANISPNEFIKIFKKSKKELLMEEDELLAYNNLDDKLTVYRGVKPKSSTKALSWTTDFKVAKWFADRWEKNGKVYKAQIDKKHVFAYFTGRYESETVLDYHYLENIEEVKCDDNSEV